jgi:hypothetical protein
MSACGGGGVAQQSTDSTTVDGSDAPERPGMYDASYDPIVPSGSLRDWVSYGDAVVLATVTGEVPADPTDELGAMGWPNGQTVAVDERLWQHSSAPRPPTTIDFSGGLLVVEPLEGTTPLTLRLATVGRQYVVPVGKYDNGGWAPDAPMLEIIDGRIDPEVGGTYPFADALADVEIADVATVLSSVDPDPLAEGARPGDPEARYQATVTPVTTMQPAS